MHIRFMAQMGLIPTFAPVGPSVPTLFSDRSSLKRGTLTSRKRGVRALRKANKPRRVHITEKSIFKYGVVALGAWAFLKYQCWHNGIVYRGWSGQTEGKFGWSRAVFFTRMRLLCDVGLAKKDPWGNWKLANIKDVIGLHKNKSVKHRCGLPIQAGDSERDVRDVVQLKILEMAWRQKEYHCLTPDQRYALKRISTKEYVRQNRIRLLEEREAPTKKSLKGLGSTEEELLKFAQDGFVPMNTESIMRHTGLGRAAVFSLKRRLKARGLIQQENRTYDVPPKFTPYLPMGVDEMQAAYRGKFSISDSGRWFFHQAAMYRSTIAY